MIKQKSMLQKFCDPYSQIWYISTLYCIKCIELNAFISSHKDIFEVFELIICMNLNHIWQIQM